MFSCGPGSGAGPAAAAAAAGEGEGEGAVVLAVHTSIHVGRVQVGSTDRTSSRAYKGSRLVRSRKRLEVGVVLWAWYGVVRVCEGRTESDAHQRTHGRTFQFR